MRVAEIMTKNVKMAAPNETVREIAERMASEDIGFLPVGDHDRLVGTITDRDIVTRGVAQGRDGKSTVQDLMSTDVKYCFDDEDIDHVMRNLGDLQVRRLPVVDREKRLVGIVSLADAALKAKPEHAAHGLSGVVNPGGSHSQSAGSRR
jgi:CBS domain-containing protein